MSATAALTNAFAGLRARLRLPETVPEFGDRAYMVYRVIWYAAIALAVVGSAAGLYYRFTGPGDNAGLVLGSRVGIVVAEEDATRIRFPVGPATSRLGIKPGDDIVAIEGLELPEVAPFSPIAVAQHGEEPSYLLLEDLFYGTDQLPVSLRIRSAAGKTRDISVVPGDQHINAGSAAVGIPPALLRFVDLLHVLTYPFLLAAAWLLHKRQPRDPVSCILSLAILFSIATQEPSAAFLDTIVGIPRPAVVALYDIGNIFLLSGILLFPNGRLSTRVIGLIAMMPILMVLRGDAYRALYIFFMLAAVLMLIDCLRKNSGEYRSQVQWGLLGFSGYVMFLAFSLISDMAKWQVSSFGLQMYLEMAAGFALGFAFLLLVTGLLVALLRYRLYDAEFVISRSASFAAVTLVMGALVAGGIQAMGDTIKSVFGSNAGAGAAGVGAAMATVLISPIHSRIHGWMEERIHRKLTQLRERLPELIRDMREVASLPEMLREVLVRIHGGIPTVRTAVIVDDHVEQVNNVTEAEVVEWQPRFAAEEEKLACNPGDSMFRIRVPICTEGEPPLGWLLAGPRPDGSSLSKDEREVLDELADPIARAIRIVQKRDREEQELWTSLGSLRQRIEGIERLLDSPGPPKSRPMSGRAASAPG
jgi:hypothetical protein